MSNTDLHVQCNVVEVDHQNDDIKDDYEYIFLSDGSNTQLDDFLETWREEIYRKHRILRLNDDCFFKIFSYLPANDLCAISETCRDFQRLSRYYVEGHSKRFHLERASFYNKWSKIRLNDAKRFIRNFGQNLKILSLKNDEFESDANPMRLLPLLDRYCTQLQDFVIDVSHLNPMTIIQSEQLNANLQRLSIGAYMIPSDTNIFGPLNIDAILTHFTALKHLEVNHLRWTVGEGAYIAKRYEALESLSLQSFILPPVDTLTAFLSENRQLKRVKFSCCFFNKCTYPLTLPTIPNLESFTLLSDNNFHVSHDDIGGMQIHQLRLSDITGDIPALKKLRIDLKNFQKSNLNPLLDRLAVHNTIEKICIERTHEFPDEMEKHLCALTSLKILRFTWVKGFTNEIAKKLACGLPNLPYVEFHYCDVTFSMIEYFLEFSHGVHTICLFMHVLHKKRSPFTKAVLLSMINARRRNRHRNVVLTLILNDKVISEAKRNEEGVLKLLLDCADVIRVLPSRTINILK
ncbi:uncharacterized protein LOC119068344 [Bradysia coprophila]|uniref:uncharacterized protein LOC119068344 n=1 Tax=Bradysia coprophila TaxID=38358 RepID=UPI00187DDA77|nr:uncharacterized protein LOC119068344 [Bradysia coprophila]